MFISWTTRPDNIAQVPQPSRPAAWRLDRPPSDYVLAGVRAVTPERVIEDAHLVVRGGRIADLGAGRPRRVDADGGGLWCLPGLIDVHSDVLGRELHPRPGAQLSLDMAVGTADQRLSAAGLTTAFHGVAHGSHSPVGVPIGSPSAQDALAAIRRTRGQVLHRVDIRSREAIGSLEAALALEPVDQPALVSHEDHTPGIGQYAQPAAMERFLIGREGMDPQRAREHVAWWREHRESRGDVAAATLDRLAVLAAAGRIRLMGHDPASSDDVEGLVARGGAVAEFPTTTAAARADRAAGLLVVAGAPNVVRGGSHTANVSARQLVADGLVDALTSDYMPGSMAGAVEVLVQEGLTDVVGAVALVTSGPARAAGLADRGALEPGRRADLVLLDRTAQWPVVRAVLRA